MEGALTTPIQPIGDELQTRLVVQWTVVTDAGGGHQGITRGSQHVAPRFAQLRAPQEVLHGHVLHQVAGSRYLPLYALKEEERTVITAIIIAITRVLHMPDTQLWGLECQRRSRRSCGLSVQKYRVKPKLCLMNPTYVCFSPSPLLTSADYQVITTVKIYVPHH